MADERAQYFRRLRKLRGSTRRWSVLAGTLTGAAAVLTPYQGLGLADAVWAAAAGGSAVLTAWRWSDLRALASRPAPPPVDPAAAAERTRARIVAAVEALPAGREALAGVRRHRTRLALRGSAVAPGWQRLDRAATTMTELADRLTGPAAPAALEAAVAQRSLLELTDRVVAVERALRFAPPDTRAALRTAHRELVERFEAGVAAYERLVAAAAGYLAEEGRVGPVDPAVDRLTEATDLLRGVATGLAELRSFNDPVSTPDGQPRAGRPGTSR